MSASDSMAPRISIVVPTRNRHGAIRECVKACLDSYYPREDFEVLVIDDGSVPEVPAFDQANVRLLRQSGSGPAVARNRGLREARGQWIAFTDDDCCPDANWLTYLTAALARYPERLVGGFTVNALTGNPYSTASQLLVTFLYGYFQNHPRQWFFTSNNMAASREKLLALGGFDESFPLPAAEDRDLCDRWVKDTGKMHYVPQALVNHSHKMSLKGFVRQQFQYGRGARVLSLRRRLRGTKFHIEADGFYRRLFSEPFRAWPVPEAMRLLGLLIISQLATVAGFAMEAIVGRPKSR